MCFVFGFHRFVVKQTNFFLHNSVITNQQTHLLNRSAHHRTSQTKSAHKSGPEARFKIKTKKKKITIFSVFDFLCLIFYNRPKWLQLVIFREKKKKKNGKCQWLCAYDDQKWYCVATSKRYCCRLPLCINDGYLDIFLFSYFISLCCYPDIDVIRKNRIEIENHKKGENNIKIYWPMDIYVLVYKCFVKRHNWSQLTM